MLNFLETYTTLQITVGHRLLPNVYESWSVKRNCKFVKMTEQNLPIAEIFYSVKYPQFLVLFILHTNLACTLTFHSMDFVQTRSSEEYAHKLT